MKVHNASRRALDCYVALLEGFYPEDSPNGPVLVPVGIAGPDWAWRADVHFASFVPAFTRDFTTGVATLARYNMAIQVSGPDQLENAFIALLLDRFGEDLPPIKGMPKSMMKKKKQKKLTNKI